MLKKFFYHFFLIILFILIAFLSHFFYNKYVIINASNNNEKSVTEEPIQKQPIYLTKAPKCEDIEGIEISSGYYPPKNYSGMIKYCNDSTGYVLAYGKVVDGQYVGIHINYNIDGSFSDKRQWVLGKKEGKSKYLLLVGVSPTNGFIF